MNPKQTWIALVSIILMLGGVMRLADLDRRPIHGDEAVNALKLGQLIEDGEYRYDSSDFHGPVLNFLTLPAAWIAGVRTTAELNAGHLRIITGLAGLLLVLFLMLLKNELGYFPSVMAGLIAALSPAMVFYSRYYIMEMILVLFSLATIMAGRRYSRTRDVSWAIITGSCAGLMIATKETAIVMLAAMALALVILTWKKGYRPNWLHWGLGAVAGIITTILLLTSFFTNPQALAEMLGAATSYAGKATVEGIHNQPVWYYLGLLIFHGGEVGIWTEAPVLLLAGYGIWIIRLDPLYSRFIRFLALYAIILLVLFSLIPYKTPWNLLPFYLPIIMLAGIGIDGLFWRYGRDKYWTMLGATVAVMALLSSQAYTASFVKHSSPVNPYVYAHPVADLPESMAEIQKLGMWVDGNQTQIDVIFPGNDYWPLPWYFRSWSNVAWRSGVTPDITTAPIFIVAPEIESALIDWLYGQSKPGTASLYVPLFNEAHWLRPGKEMRVYVRFDVMEVYRQQQDAAQQ